MNWQRGVRLSVFLMFAAFMTAGPFYSQLLGGNRVLFRSWTMFSGSGVGTIDARFTHVLDDGTEIVLNRHELLAEMYRQQKKKRREGWFYRNWPKWKSSPGVFWLVHVRNGGSVLHARRLCEVVGSGSIRIDSRIARRRGWVPALDGKVIECDGEAVAK